MYKYFPHTQEDIDVMLRKVGVDSLDDLYAEVPESVRFKGEYDIPTSKSELEIRQTFDRLCKNNRLMTVFAGAGVYDHYTPAVVPNIIGRSEFLTSYTPYQAEISQGTLHYIFEWQSMMAELTGLDISNASMYDGCTATAEAMLMANANAKKTNRVLVSEAVDPRILDVMRTYARFHGVEIVTIATRDGVTDKDDLDRLLAEGPVAGVVAHARSARSIAATATTTRAPTLTPV